MQSLPILDLSPFLFPSPRSARQALATSLHTALATHGFFLLQVPPHIRPLLAQARQAAREFFALDPSIKQQMSITNHENRHRHYPPPHDPTHIPVRGYQAVCENVTGGYPDYQEAIDLYSEDLSRVPITSPLHGTNPWVDCSLRNLMPKYVAAMKDLGAAVMRAVATALELHESYFEPYYGEAFWICRVIAYPQREEEKEEEEGVTEGKRIRLGCGEHTDYGCLTLINADDVPDTLQIRHHETNQWMSIQPMPDTLVVNIGDMLSLWTNHLYRSTPHRVLRPTQQRISIPFFFEPNFDTHVTPLEKFKRPGQNNMPETVIYGEHLTQRILRNFVTSPQTVIQQDSRRLM